jgi:hypothetical protein
MTPYAGIALALAIGLMATGEATAQTTYDW